jgi:tetratricopeptide (TPR) repeat protein
MLSKARLLAPGDPSVLAYLYVLSGKPEYENTLIRYFDKLDAEFFIGKAFLETGRPERAAFFLSRLCRIIPVYRRGQICLAASLAGSGDWEGGAKIYFREHAGRQDPVFLEKEILAAFRKWSESPAASAQAHFFYGQALRLFGHYAKALEAQKQALLLAPGHALIKREIQRLGELKESYLRAD